MILEGYILQGNLLKGLLYPLQTSFLLVVCGFTKQL